ncbi:MAG: hypothetical protein JXB23_17555 [Candidatus Aminicenantes bacterium]|nr:hypothetical protein [Candidatus Aminicenantes bacterium]
MADSLDQKRLECWDIAVHAFGTARIFEERAKKLKINLKWITFFGIGVPMSVGGVLMAFGLNSAYLPIAMTTASVLGVFQLIFSLWSLVSRWEDNLSYSLESGSLNHRISRNFKSLAIDPPSNQEVFRMRFEILSVEEANRNDLDNKQGITEKERRMGMRAALREFKRPCAGCKEIPTSMKATDCNICGNF